MLFKIASVSCYTILAFLTSAEMWNVYWW